MVEPKSPRQRVMKIASRTGIARWRDFVAAGAHPEVVRRLHKEGVLVKVARGVYALAGHDGGENRQLAEAAKRVPSGVVFLLSALRFHGLTTQQPHRIWLAVGRTARLPKATGLPLHVLRLSGPAYTEGVETHEVEGVLVKVYSVAKTVADCFKYRNKIGLDVALEALREAKRARRLDTDELWRFAKVDRVANVMRPYLEALA